MMNAHEQAAKLIAELRGLPDDANPRAISYSVARVQTAQRHALEATEALTRIVGEEQRVWNLAGECPAGRPGGPGIGVAREGGRGT